MQPRVILDSKKFALTIDRLCFQLIENHNDFGNTALIGVQPRGTNLSNRIEARLKQLAPKAMFDYGKLDITFYRDDYRTRTNPPLASEMAINFSVQDKRVVLIDDVLFTGRTIRSAMDALLDFGRPSSVELLVLIDRRFTRHLPIQADYVGQTVDTIASELVKVEWQELEGNDKVWILTNKNHQ
ncbi:MAG: bifunctional pyr operon transcriptional regulator/uracil phosphoribosyltransferase PyrR [Chitinophagales bacterium]|nr:bifunctional pyr operon transcriptional regulator/uracil phosphoribosyltransferase PyrR [Chitinophagales bacterium]